MHQKSLLTRGYCSTETSYVCACVCAFMQSSCVLPRSCSHRFFHPDSFLAVVKHDSLIFLSSFVIFKAAFLFLSHVSLKKKTPLYHTSFSLSSASEKSSIGAVQRTLTKAQKGSLRKDRSAAPSSSFHHALFKPL